jgi:hypothetical protein
VIICGAGISMRLVVCANAALALAVGSHAQQSGEQWLVIGVVGKWVVCDNASPNCNSRDPVTLGKQVRRDMFVKRDGDPSSESLSFMVNGTQVTYACDDPSKLPNHLSCSSRLPLAQPPKTMAGGSLVTYLSRPEVTSGDTPAEIKIAPVSPSSLIRLIQGIVTVIVSPVKCLARFDRHTKERLCGENGTNGPKVLPA